MGVVWHASAMNRDLVRIGARRIGQTLIGQDGVAPASTYSILFGRFGRGDYGGSARRVGAVDHAMDVSVASGERNHRVGRSELRPIWTTHHGCPFEDQQERLVGMVVV